MRVLRNGGRLSVAICLAVFALPATAFSYDGINDRTLGDVPYRSAATFGGEGAFNSQTSDRQPPTPFTESSQEVNASTARLACGRPNSSNAAWGAKTAWFRFATAVEGKVFLNIESMHNLYYSVYTAPTSIPPGTAQENQLTSRDCFDGVHNGGGESYSFGHQIPANQTIYIQIASICQDDVPPDPGPTSPCDANERAAAPAGNVSFRFAFDPAAGDRDGDQLADPVDDCPDTPGRATNGCRLPDEDGDGFAANATQQRSRDCDDDDPRVNPDAKEIIDNDIDENCDDLKAFDRDRDGSVDQPAGPDCRPGNKNINPSAKEIPGNRVDENCDEVKVPFPRIRSDARALFRGDRATGRVFGFRSINLSMVRKGMTIIITCKGTQCPFARRIRPPLKRSGSSLTVAQEFRRRKDPDIGRLPPGARVTILITKRGFIGVAHRYTIRSRGKPKRITRCLNVGTTRPLRKKCSGFAPA